MNSQRFDEMESQQSIFAIRQRVDMIVLGIESFSLGCCGRSLLVSEAGGQLSDFHGSTFSVYSKEIVASNQKLHSEMLRILKMR